MKEWVMTQTFPISVEDFFNIFFKTSEFQIAYQTATACTEISVAEWAPPSDDDDDSQGWEEGARLVQFRTPINAPQSLLKMLGTNSTAGTAKQYYGFEEQEGEKTLKVRQRIFTKGVPLSNLYYVEVISVVARHEAGCELTITCKTECQGFAYGLKAIIDTVLQSESKKSHVELLRVAGDFCQAALSRIKATNDGVNTPDNAKVEGASILNNNTGLTNSNSNATLSPAPQSRSRSVTPTPQPTPTDAYLSASSSVTLGRPGSATDAMLRDRDREDVASESSETGTYVSAAMDDLMDDTASQKAKYSPMMISHTNSRYGEGMGVGLTYTPVPVVPPPISAPALREHLLFLRALREDGTVDQDLVRDQQRMLLQDYYDHILGHNVNMNMMGPETAMLPPPMPMQGHLPPSRAPPLYQDVYAEEDENEPNWWALIRSAQWSELLRQLKNMVDRLPSVKMRQVLCSWFALAGLIHLLLDGGYVLFGGGTRTNDLRWAMAPWRVYATSGDSRYKNADTFIITLQVIVGFIHGPLSLLTAYGIKKAKAWYPVCAIVTCVAELYGRVILIATFDSLTTKLEDVSSDFMLVFVSWTLLWMLVPTAMLFYFIPLAASQHRHRHDLLPYPLLPFDAPAPRTRRRRSIDRRPIGMGGMGEMGVNPSTPSAFSAAGGNGMGGNMMNLRTRSFSGNSVNMGVQMGTMGMVVNPGHQLTVFQQAAPSLRGNYTPTVTTATGGMNTPHTAASMTPTLTSAPPTPGTVARLNRSPPLLSTTI
eukprot:TRINITY_DN626_c0_g1::TRINITY_DN626_c0_g1_i1::g.28877::m.28877 TRINITY_DN626_c0_g1::TRINITY_DN626_c0_g1_i1::g.28877  ORF type:complete len:766 (+),score=117.12,sp/O48962/EBP_ARATH/27.40/4e-12,EBP/PF05241.7/1.9e-24 TRINITY_DN626_c0_g1_i1:41-2338(+)